MASILRVALLCLPLFAAAASGAADLKPWPGGATPGLELRDLDGRAHRLAEYRGKVVLVNFWATWCAPCRDEMPSIQRLKEKLAGKPFVVLAVNLDEPEARVRKFLSQMKVDFTVLLDPEKKAAKAWDARILPVSFVIGPDGRIHYSLVGDLDWGDDRVVSRISELLPETK
ncbi:MAG: TlpA family protein disulfide reductase [Burkholderiales bacterium]